MLARHAALEDVGWFDERFFLFSEETDLCWRLKRAGWQVVHMPEVTIRHFEHEHGRTRAWRPNPPTPGCSSPASTSATSLGYRWALALRYALRVGVYSALACAGAAAAARAALATVLDGRPPFAARPPVSVRTASGGSSGDDRQRAGLDPQLDAASRSPM